MASNSFFRVAKPGPARRVCGGEDGTPQAIADGMTDWWREHFMTLPIEDFARPYWLRAAMLDSAIRRGWIERSGFHVAGQWQYRLTQLGRAMRQALQPP